MMLLPGPIIIRVIAAGIIENLTIASVKVLI